MGDEETETPLAGHLIHGLLLKSVSLTQAPSGAVGSDVLCYSSNFIQVAEGRNDPRPGQLEEDRCDSF